MLVDGKWIDNITCPFCRYRHPAELSCQDAERIAKENKVLVQDETIVNTHYEYLQVDENEPSDLGIWPLEVPDGFTVIKVDRLKELEEIEFMYGSVSK